MRPPSRGYRLTPEQRAAIRSPRAWLTAVTSRLCLDVLASARARLACWGELPC